MHCPEDREHEDVLCQRTPGRRVLRRGRLSMLPKQPASRRPLGSSLPTPPRAVGPQGACPEERSSRLFAAWRRKQYLLLSVRPSQAPGRELRPRLKGSFANYGIALCALASIASARSAGIGSSRQFAVALVILSLVFNNWPAIKRLKRPSRVVIMLGIFLDLSLG